MVAAGVDTWFVVSGVRQESPGSFSDDDLGTLSDYTYTTV